VLELCNKNVSKRSNKSQTTITTYYYKGVKMMVEHRTAGKKPTFQGRLCYLERVATQKYVTPLDYDGVPLTVITSYGGKFVTPIGLNKYVDYNHLSFTRYSDHVFYNTLCKGEICYSAKTNFPPLNPCSQTGIYIRHKTIAEVKEPDLATVNASIRTCRSVVTSKDVIPAYVDMFKTLLYLATT